MIPPTTPPIAPPIIAPIWLDEVAVGTPSTTFEESLWTAVLVGASTVSVATTEYPIEVTNVVVVNDAAVLVWSWPLPNAIVDVTDAVNIIVFVVTKVVVCD